MDKRNLFAFHKENYKFLYLGLAINILGFILMIGGGSDDPNKFNEEELFSPIRLTVAPILIVLGYIILIYSIMRKPNQKSEQ